MQTTTAANWTPVALPNDIVASGTVTRYVNGQPDSSGTIVVKMLRPDYYSIQTTFGSDTSTTLMRAGAAAIRHTSRTTSLPINGVKSWHFPFFTDIPNLTDTHILYDYIALETVDGQQAHRLKLWRDGSENPARAAEIQRSSQLTVWVSSTTSLPVQVQYMKGTLTSHLAFNARIRKLSDYRLVNGVSVPFAQEEWQDGQKLLSIQFQNISFNTGLTGGDFQ